MKWLTMLDTKLKPLLLWPEHEDLRRAMPALECFHASFKKYYTCSSSHYQLFIERPSNILARAATGPLTSTIISDAWGGRVSDKYLT